MNDLIVAYVFRSPSDINHFFSIGKFFRYERTRFLILNQSGTDLSSFEKIPFPYDVRICKVRCNYIEDSLEFLEEDAYILFVNSDVRMVAPIDERIIKVMQNHRANILTLFSYGSLHASNVIINAVLKIHLYEDTLYGKIIDTNLFKSQRTPFVLMKLLFQAGNIFYLKEPTYLLDKLEGNRLQDVDSLHVENTLKYLDTCPQKEILLPLFCGKVKLKNEKKFFRNVMKRILPPIMTKKGFLAFYKAIKKNIRNYVMQ